MSFDHGLKPGDVINNDQLMGIFKCSPQGGMRRSLRTNSLVIVSNHTRAIYEDRWIHDTLHYTGMGLEGDQNINAAQNKTLAESVGNGVDVFLFEVFEAGNYIYQGEVALAEEPYQEDQPDVNGNLRKVWIFPLKISDQSEAKPVPESIIINKQAKKEKEAKRLTDAELETRAKFSKKGVGARKVSSQTYERNVYVAELATIVIKLLKRN